jgi:hypothetical protein
VLNNDGIRTLVDLIIANPTQVDLLPNLGQLKDLLSLMRLKPKKGAIATNTPLINSSL